MTYRHPLASDTHHPFYRAQPERWLETLVREDPARIDARLSVQPLYTQVPAIAAGDREVIDLLGVTREGRLAVIELKADEHLHLPQQAADYWLRVRCHQRQGDLQRYGYFTGGELQAKPRLSIWWRRDCAFILRRMLSCASSRRRWRLYEWVLRRSGAEDCEWYCGNRPPHETACRVGVRE